MRIPMILGSVVVMAALWLPSNFAQAQLLQVFPEQRQLHVRSPEQLPSIPVPTTDVPYTVSEEKDNREQRSISLDDAIQLAIQNADVIRVLTGISAASSGRTIYDVAISNTGIDTQTAVFDPTLDVSLNWNKSDGPQSLFTTDSLNTNVSLAKRMFNGGTVGLDANSIGSYFGPGVFPLDPDYRSSVELSLRQPMMRGYGRAANLAPVLVARINTERSYFQFKDSVQELVRGVIAAYWNLVAARVNVWARQQQIEQAEFAFQRAIARKQQGLDRAADVAQARSALANFNASLITARANLLLNETALRNIMGLDPSSTQVLVPSSMPVLERVEFDWNEIIRIAEQYRPDIIERKLVLEADRYTQVQANNQAKPQFDGIANYNWDGFNGVLPSGALLGNQSGAGFNFGVNFSVPMGLRQSRASLRRQELIIAQDRVNLEQSIFQMVQQLTINYRNLDQFFEQYVAFQEARAAARLNFENQVGEVRAGRREFINALQAITDWGNAVSQEASSITQYNTELANVERQTGTILETHGIRFVEERYGSLGPQGLLGIRRTTECYSESLHPEGSTDRYQESDKTSDDAFDLKALDDQRESNRPTLDPEPESTRPIQQRAIPQPMLEPPTLEPPIQGSRSPLLSRTASHHQQATDRSVGLSDAVQKRRVGSPSDFVVPRSAPQPAVNVAEKQKRWIERVFQR